MCLKKDLNFDHFQMNRPPPTRDWTLYVYAQLGFKFFLLKFSRIISESKFLPPSDRDPTKQLDTRKIDLEPCGTFESVKFNLTFPYYRNVAHKAIIVKGKLILRTCTSTLRTCTLTLKARKRTCSCTNYNQRPLPFS